MFLRFRLVGHHCILNLGSEGEKTGRKDLEIKAPAPKSGLIRKVSVDEKVEDLDRISVDPTIKLPSTKRCCLSLSLSFAIRGDVND